MIKGTTSTGFSYEISEQAIDNMELLDAIVEVDTNPLMVSKVVNMLLPADQKKALYDHLRREDGTVPIIAVSEAVAEIFNGNQKTKN